jgi:hypothetical protein
MVVTPFLSFRLRKSCLSAHDARICAYAQIQRGGKAQDRIIL